MGLKQETEAFFMVAEYNHRLYKHDFNGLVAKVAVVFWSPLVYFLERFVGKQSAEEVSKLYRI